MEAILGSRYFIGIIGAGVVAAGAFAGAPSGAAAQTKLAAYAASGEESSAPIGWHMFCREAEGRADCNVSPMKAAQADLDERRWRELLAINNKVNREIEPMTDLDHWGVPEKWSYPTDGKGDCEDYVLEKRKRLIAAGFPRQSLLITVVRDKKGDGHAVLMVRTDGAISSSTTRSRRCCSGRTPATSSSSASRRRTRTAGFRWAMSTRRW